MLLLLGGVSVSDNLGRDSHRRVKHSFGVEPFDAVLVHVPLLLPKFPSCVTLTLHVVWTRTGGVKRVWRVAIERLRACQLAHFFFPNLRHDHMVI